MASSAAPPPIGQSFIDALGNFWRVETVIRRDSDPGFYLVRMRSGPSPACDEQRHVFAPQEFHALVRQKRLAAVGPDVLPPAALRRATQA